MSLLLGSQTGLPAEAVSAPTTKKFCQDARIHPSLRAFLLMVLPQRDGSYYQVWTKQWTILSPRSHVHRLYGGRTTKTVPVVTLAGGLGCHINAMEFVDHIPQNEYPAGALAVALYIASGVRGMERGTMSEQRSPDGTEPWADMELLRLAMPRRVFTLSQVKYAVDRIVWLHENRHLIQGLAWVEEPKMLRFFFGRLKPVSDWQEKLAAKFRQDFGDSL